jgi:hypothetical protein
MDMEYAYALCIFAKSSTEKIPNARATEIGLINCSPQYVRRYKRGKNLSMPGLNEALSPLQ